MLFLCQKNMGKNWKVHRILGKEVKAFLCKAFSSRSIMDSMLSVVVTMIIRITPTWFCFFLFCQFVFQKKQRLHLTVKKIVNAFKVVLKWDFGPRLKTVKKTCVIFVLLSCQIQIKTLLCLQMADILTGPPIYIPLANIFNLCQKSLK